MMVSLSTTLKRTLLIWLLLELISATQVKRDQEMLLLSWLKVLAVPFTASASWVVDTWQDLSWGLGDTRRLVAEVQQVSRELEVTKANNYLLAEENRALREAQRASLALPSIVDDKIISRCTYRSLSLGQLEVSAGLREGVKVDSAVISADGIVGRVVKVAAVTCHVELLTHPAAAVAATSVPENTQGLVTGCGLNCLQVELVPRNAQLLRGTLFVTSGVDGIYPPGIPVATVTSIRETGKPFLEIAATPTAQLQSLSVVVVLPSAGSAQGAER